MSYFDSLKLTSKLKSSLKCIPATAPLVTGEGRLKLAEESLITLKQKFNSAVMNREWHLLTNSGLVSPDHGV